ncbi:MAG: FAD-dependent oxidoreductase, partial [Christensenellaceae bacterium]
KNTFINSPKVLDCQYRLKSNPNIRFAGQITGVEGYLESASSGLAAGIFTAYELQEKEIPVFDSYTATGALCNYVSNSISSNFQPMNINFGIMMPLGIKIRNKEEKNTMISQRAMDRIAQIIEKFKL